MITTYTRQNKIQKKAISIFRFFKPDYKTIRKLKTKGIEVYTPKLNKIKLGIGVFLILLCIVTPLTNWAIPFIIKGVLK